MFESNEEDLSKIADYTKHDDLTLDKSYKELLNDSIGENK